MVVQAEEGRLTTSAARILVATAVPAERDAVARAFPEPGSPVRLPGVTPHRTGTAYDLLAAACRPRPRRRVRLRRPHRRRPGGHAVRPRRLGRYRRRVPSRGARRLLVLADTIVAADLGAETADGFLPVTELGFGTVTHHPPRSLVQQAVEATGGRAGAVLTVSTVTGTASRAAALRARHPRALAEAMEGFGVAEAAAAHGVPVLEIRAVSNPVGPRDRAAWRIGEALAALTTAFGKLAPVLESWNPHEHRPDQ